MSRKNTEISGGPRTKAVHAGEHPDIETGASAPNLVMSSTFVTEEAAGFSAHNLAEDPGFLYGRWANPTVSQLESKLCAFENAESCLCTGSGMAAVSAIFFSLLSAGDHLVISDVCYAGVAELARATLPRMGIEISRVDTSNVENIAAALKPNSKLIWLETPANPIIRLTDLAAVAGIAKQHGNVKVGVDSTFSTPIATRPLDLGIDFVMHSLTKYIGGHGDALGGAILGARDDIEAIRLEAGIHYGAVLSPFNAWLIMRGAATLPLRMKGHQESAMEVASFLENHSKVTAVMYPGLESHPQHELAKRQMKNYSGMIAFQVADGPALADKMTRELQIIHYAVSLGHHRSLIFWMGTDALMESSFALEGAQLESYRHYAGDGILRLSVGLEDGVDLCADLDRVLG